MQAGSRSGALAIIAFAIGGIVWIGLELTAVSLGFENPDSPAISLRFLREHAENFQQAGLVCS
jgi:hypothetical protein